MSITASPLASTLATIPEARRNRGSSTLVNPSLRRKRAQWCNLRASASTHAAADFPWLAARTSTMPRYFADGAGWGSGIPDGVIAATCLDQRC
jgi:hypothetical protein